MKRHVSLFLLLILLGVLLAGHPQPEAVPKWDGGLPVPPWVTTP
jgi:hypothetical protein